MSRGLFLDRRVFLISYDPVGDDDLQGLREGHQDRQEEVRRDKHVEQEGHDASSVGEADSGRLREAGHVRQGEGDLQTRAERARRCP